MKRGHWPHQTDPRIREAARGFRKMGLHELARAALRRECGPCTACCHTLSVEELSPEKPLHCDCPHQRQADEDGGPGCAIYATRPQQCRDFFCGWRIGLPPKRGMRPDESRVIVDLASGSTFDTQLYVLRAMDPGVDVRPVLNAIVPELVAMEDAIGLLPKGLACYVGVCWHHMKGGDPVCYVRPRTQDFDRWRAELEANSGRALPSYEKENMPT